MKENGKEETLVNLVNIVDKVKENKTFKWLQEIQILIRKESSLKGLCKIK